MHTHTQSMTYRHTTRTTANLQHISKTRRAYTDMCTRKMHNIVSQKYLKHAASPYSLRQILPCAEIVEGQHQTVLRAQ